jgi:hypothetical protein
MAGVQGFVHRPECSMHEQGHVTGVTLPEGTVVDGAGDAREG